MIVSIDVYTKEESTPKKITTFDKDLLAEAVRIVISENDNRCKFAVSEMIAKKSLPLTVS